MPLDLDLFINLRSPIAIEGRRQASGGAATARDREVGGGGERRKGVWQAGLVNNICQHLCAWRVRGSGW